MSYGAPAIQTRRPTAPASGNKRLANDSLTMAMLDAGGSWLENVRPARIATPSVVKKSPVTVARSTRTAFDPAASLATRSRAAPPEYGAAVAAATPAIPG